MTLDSVGISWGTNVAWNDVVSGVGRNGGGDGSSAIGVHEYLSQSVPSVDTYGERSLSDAVVCAKATKFEIPGAVCMIPTFDLLSGMVLAKST